MGGIRVAVGAGNGMTEGWKDGGWTDLPACEAPGRYCVKIQIFFNIFVSAERRLWSKLCTEVYLV